MMLRGRTSAARNPRSDGRRRQEPAARALVGCAGSRRVAVRLGAACLVVVPFAVAGRFGVAFLAGARFGAAFALPVVVLPAVFAGARLPRP